MVPDGMSCLGLEYFCFEGDGVWMAPDADLITMATAEAAKIGHVPQPAKIAAAETREPFERFHETSPAAKTARPPIRHRRGLIPEISPVVGFRRSRRTSARALLQDVQKAASGAGLARSTNRKGVRHCAQGRNRGRVRDQDGRGIHGAGMRKVR